MIKCCLQENLGKYFRFDSMDVLCDQFNKFLSTLKRQKKKQILNIHG